MRISPTIEKILELLQAGSENTIALLDALMSGSAESRKKLRSAAHHSLPSKTNRAGAYRESQKFYSLLIY